MQPLRLGLVGYGKIAQDQHVPAILANPAYQLCAVATLGDPCPGVENYDSLRAMLEHCPNLDAVAFCTPPQGRYAQVRGALLAGKHVLVEKPPCASLGEAMALTELASERGLSCLFAWHSRFAPAVASAQAWLAQRSVLAVTVQWKEDVRKWHPGQQWIWQPGGLGVFDPGINALSIVTHLLEQPLFVKSAELRVPSNRQAPIAASVRMTDSHDLAVHAEFDWGHVGDELWRIDVRCADGTLRLDHGGASLSLDGQALPVDEEAEYPALYRHFAQLIRDGASDTDLQPLRLVADAFFTGSRTVVEPFND
ncbi:Gfo/Idh/MocA family protein [Pseudomonas sp. nanlin1]|uniref:Gfo/Idh/MocA family protein n=1 Tax=Pseudomonas sp. nanlin1 TaxID=3040605 RepID=UPI00388F360D